MKRSKLGQKKKNMTRTRRHRRRLTTECLESRELLAGDTMALHNAGLPLDTNNDGARSSLDALVVVNDLNRHGARDVVAGVPAAGLVDTNGDGVVSAADVLGVVNYLNRGSGEGDAKVQVRLAVTAVDSLDPITSIEPNEDFLLRAFVTDLTDPAEGVFGGFVDVTYQALLAGVSGEVIHASAFPNGPSSVLTVDGVLDEVGSFSGSFTGGGEAEQLLFSVPMTSEGVGTLTFNGNPPDVLPAHEFTLFGENEGVVGDEIMFINTTLEVVDENAPVVPTANDNVYALNEDSTLTVSAALGVVADDLPAGATLTAAVLSDVENGTLQLNADGSFTYTPNENFNGRDSFTYVPSNGTSTATTPGTVTLTVNSVNDAPVAVDDSFSTPAGVTLIRTQPGEGLLVNDFDVEGEELTLLTDLFEGADNGILTASALGGIAYIPDAGFVGTETVTYVIQDASGLVSNRATLTIEVTGDSRPVAADDSFTVSQDTVLNVEPSGVLANDTDPNGDDLVAQVLTQPANGTVVLGTSGALRYTPNLGFVGVDSFTYQATDGPNVSDPATVTITVEEDQMSTAPDAADDAFTTPEDNALNVAAPGVLANDIDFDGSPLTAVLLTQPANGVVELNENGSFVYTPNLNFNGTDSFTYEASDGVRADPATVVITVESGSDAPQTSPESYDVDFETPLVVSAADGVLANDFDVDSPVITSILLVEPENGVVELALDGSFTYTPNSDFTGTDSFTYGVQDGFLTAFATTTLNVQPENQSTDLVAFRVAVTDANGTELTELGTGDAFELRVFVDDVSSDQGVFAAYTDVTWRANGAVVTGSIDHGQIYVNGPTGSSATPGLLDEAGGFDGIEPLGSDEQLLFTVPMRATGDGVLTFATDPADNSPFGDVLLFVTREDAIPTDRISYGSTTVTVEGLSEPVANADSYETNDGSLTISAAAGVLNNDLPAAGGAELTATLVDLPNNGDVTLNADGSFTYVADTGFVGADTFTYQAVGGDANSATATVTINVDDPDPNSVSGVVFFDTDNNGVRRAGEHGFGGIEVTLTGTTVFGDNISRTATTSTSGAYAFGQLPAGTYVVSQEQPAIVIDGIDTLDGETVSDTVELDLNGGANVTLNFGERGLQPQFIGNPLFTSTRARGGAGIGLNPDGSTSWHCTDSTWSGVQSVEAQIVGSSITITAVRQDGSILVGSVPTSNRNVTVRGNSTVGYFVELTGAISDYSLQQVANPNGEAVDAVFAE